MHGRFAARCQGTTSAEAVCILAFISPVKFLVGSAAVRRASETDPARFPVGPLKKHALRRLQLFGTVPDGTGSQTFAATLERSNGRAAALVLLKTGEGAEDFFLAQGNFIEDVVSSHVAESGGFEVAWLALETVLAAAPADGLLVGRLPAAGLLYVVGACHLGELRPQPIGVPEWTALADPGGVVAGLSARKRRVLVGRSAQWPLDHERASTCKRLH